MKVGRPPKYESVEQLQEAIDRYFDQFRSDLGGHPTMSGLAYFLGFSDRQSLYDYKGREEFSCTIKRALLRIESLHEGNLFHPSASGSIFWLKNRDWKDKTETQHSGEIGLPTLKVEIVKPDESK